VARKAEEEGGPGLAVDDDNEASRAPGVAQQAPGRREPATGWIDQDEAHWPVPFWHMDAAMASLLILQTAVDAGLGACFFGIPVEREQAVRAEFGIDPDFDPVGVITLGHRTTDTGNAGSPARRPRRSLTEVVHRGHWSRR
jgi:nitroreductase